MESKIKDHYNSDDLTQKIRTALTNSGKSLSEIDLKDLAPIDQLHTGGSPASVKLFNKVEFRPNEQVLDAGCGIGGTSRLLASDWGCRVTGIDLADQFIDAARFLTQCTGLEALISFHQGSVLDLPFDDHAFDTVLCQHILMNIENKPLAIKEFHRVLKKGGRLILHEITQGENSPVIFPVPWAKTSSISFLESWDAMAGYIQNQGFTTDLFTDDTDAACAWWEKVKAVSQKRPPRTDVLGPGLIFGKDAAFFGQNMHANFKNNSISLVEAVLKKSYDESFPSF